VNLRWLESDLTALELPDLSFDAIRSERVLMYLPDGDFERVLDELVRLLRPGGRLGRFELDYYGATILTPGAADDALLRRADDALFASLPQPLAGRRIPGLLAARGLGEIAAEPFSFAVSEPVWRRIVGDTLMAGASPDPAISIWLRERTAAAAKGQFVAAFTGVLTTPDGWKFAERLCPISWLLLAQAGQGTDAILDLGRRGVRRWRCCC
jgi:SAM-dependent methyltransferase